MRRTVLKSKIHRATVTDANLHYEGSLTIDRTLLDAADILPHEQIHVWDVTSGTRLVTYALPGPKGSGVVCVNGAGAHLIQKGNLVIIATFTALKTRAAKKYVPAVVFVDEANKIRAAFTKESDTADVPAAVASDLDAVIPANLDPTDEALVEPPPVKAGKRSRKK